MAKVDIWMPVFIGDYLRDTQELDAEENGAYLLLLMHYWLKKGDIGSDVKRLSRVAKTTIEITQYILDNFFTYTENGYKNKRADEEMSTAESRRAAATENGKKGGRPKLNPDNNPEETHRFDEGKPDDNPEESSSPPPSSSSSHPDQSPPQPDAQRSASVRIDAAINHWNSQPNLPPCKYTSAILPDVAEVTVKFDTFTEKEIHQAISSLNECWKMIEKRYRPSIFHKFVVRSLDNWLPSTKPEDKYFEKKSPELTTWTPPDSDLPDASPEEAENAFVILKNKGILKKLPDDSEDDECEIEEKTG